ncbi:MAG: chemotaxis protein MotB [Microbacteriaceae bacterium]|jgi:chemotaxis protein MotB|nr:chemotaxis protein MotB [Microbacteriaceae bacterium]
MSRGQSRKHGVDEPEHANDERWMASYMDMVTVLMITFMVLFAMSSVDSHKFAELKNSLQTGFGVVTSQKVDTATGVVVPPKAVTTKKATTLTPLQLASVEVTNLDKLEAEINSQLTAQGLQNSVSYSIDQRGLTVGLVGNQTFFDSNLAALTPIATRIIDIIGPILAATTYNLSIEGHADVRPPGPPYTSNWELAADRSIAVLSLLTSQSGLAQTRVDAVSYGSAQSAATTTAASLGQDRRVDIVVLSAQPATVRALISQVAAAGDPVAVAATN